MKRKFVVGDKIIGNRYARRYTITTCKWQGVVVGVLDQVVFSDAIVVIGADKARYTVDAECFDLVKAKLDPALPMVTRNGQKVKVVNTKDEERPYRALVQVGGRELDLTYEPNGMFHPEFELSIDLVNADG